MSCTFIKKKYIEKTEITFSFLKSMSLKTPPSPEERNQERLEKLKNLLQGQGRVEKALFIPEPLLETLDVFVIVPHKKNKIILTQSGTILHVQIQIERIAGMEGTPNLTRYRTFTQSLEYSFDDRGTCIYMKETLYPLGIEQEGIQEDHLDLLDKLLDLQKI